MKNVEKRLPFGFLGEYGTLYTKYDYEGEERQDNKIIEYMRRNYVAIKTLIQFRDNNFKKINKSKIVNDLNANNEEYVVRTSDAYFDDDIKDFRCIADVEDIVLLNGKWYNVIEINETFVHNPRQQVIYNLSLREIDRGLINVKN